MAQVGFAYICERHPDVQNVEKTESAIRRIAPEPHVDPVVTRRVKQQILPIKKIARSDLVDSFPLLSGEQILTSKRWSQWWRQFLQYGVEFNSGETYENGMQATRLKARMTNFDSASGRLEDGEARGTSGLTDSPPFKLLSGSFCLGLRETLKGPVISDAWRSK